MWKMSCSNGYRRGKHPEWERDWSEWIPKESKSVVQIHCTHLYYDLQVLWSYLMTIVSYDKSYDFLIFVRKQVDLIQNAYALPALCVLAGMLRHPTGFATKLKLNMTFWAVGFQQDLGGFQVCEKIQFDFDKFPPVPSVPKAEARSALATKTSLDRRVRSASWPALCNCTMPPMPC